MFAKCPAGRPGTADEVANVAELLLLNWLRYKRKEWCKMAKSKLVKVNQKYPFQFLYAKPYEFKKII